MLIPEVSNGNLASEGSNGDFASGDSLNPFGNLASEGNNGDFASNDSLNPFDSLLPASSERSNRDSGSGNSIRRSLFNWFVSSLKLPKFRGWNRYH